MDEQLSFFLRANAIEGTLGFVLGNCVGFNGWRFAEVPVYMHKEKYKIGYSALFAGVVDITTSCVDPIFTGKLDVLHYIKGDLSFIAGMYLGIHTGRLLNVGVSKLKKKKAATLDDRVDNKDSI